MATVPMQAAAATSSTTVPDTQSATAQATNASSTPVVDAESDDTQAASKSALANDTQDDHAQAASASTIATDGENDTAPVTAISSASAQVAHEDAPKDTRNDTAQSMVTSSAPATGPQIDAPKLNPKPAWQIPENASSMTDSKTPAKDRDWHMQYPPLGESMAIRNQPKRDQKNTGDRTDTPTSERAPLEDEAASHAEIAPSLPESDREPEAAEPPSFSGKGYVKVDFEEHQGPKPSKRAQRAENKKEKRRRHQAIQRD
ncbi:hypothetical protein CBER1_08142 [Cercospora berteroae]|uniref:Uncharacterized protein n=1 Tax=Cercospora berteroae TaxID=357750 RepID=A0A2S6CLJ3_9PEZI|nr:hypothetical protein CBER1_08142 [Cercospora berteroae]